MIGPQPVTNGKTWIQVWGPIIVFLATQALIGVVWIARLQDNVDDLGKREAAIDARVSSLDEHGTRHLDVVIDRQNNVIARLGELDARIRALEQAHK